MLISPFMIQNPLFSIHLLKIILSNLEKFNSKTELFIDFQTSLFNWWIIFNGFYL